MVIEYDLEFLACDRQFRARALLDLGYGMNDIDVVLARGDPLEERWWGKQVDVDKEEARIAGQQQKDQGDDPDYIPF